jgi:mono/diheme cytochrome c family protein
MRVLVAALIGAAVLFSIACAKPEEVTPASTPTPVDHVVAGRQLFIGKGCAACHGQNAEGTDIAPALQGHNEEQIKRQVRSPLGSMPSSGPELISDDELEKIIDYIGSLAPVAEHVEPLAMEDALVMHHWMALSALEADNPDEAEHHVLHIIGIVIDPEHKSKMGDILEDIQAGDHHDASHGIEEMIVTKAEPELAMKELHLQLALAAIGGEDSVDAKHHLNHYIDVVTGDEKVRGEEVIELLEQDNFHDAKHEIEELQE